jgi:hypothetical protein
MFVHTHDFVVCDVLSDALPCDVERAVHVCGAHTTGDVEMNWSAPQLYFVLDYVNGGELYFHLNRETKFTVSPPLSCCTVAIASAPLSPIPPPFVLVVY